MALKISLKPFEKIIIGGAVVVNGDDRCDLLIENTVPLLREKDILSVTDADTPAGKIYFIVQLMYVDRGNLAQHHASYWVLVRDFVAAAPSSLRLIDEMNGKILTEDYYPALKIARRLIDFEREAVANVHSSVGSV